MKKELIKYKQVSYQPNLRVKQYENEFYIEMQVIPRAMASSSSYPWQPIPHFKLYKRKTDAIKVMKRMIKEKFTQNVEALVINLEQQKVKFEVKDIKDKS